MYEVARVAKFCRRLLPVRALPYLWCFFVVDSSSRCCVVGAPSAKRTVDIFQRLSYLCGAEAHFFRDCSFRRASSMVPINHAQPTFCTLTLKRTGLQFRKDGINQAFCICVARKPLGDVCVDPRTRASRFKIWSRALRTDYLIPRRAKNRTSQSPAIQLAPS